MPQIPSRLPREYESSSPDHRTRYTRVVDTVLRYSNVLHLHHRVCHKVGDTMVRTSRITDGKDGKDGEDGKDNEDDDDDDDDKVNNIESVCLQRVFRKPAPP